MIHYKFFLLVCFLSTFAYSQQVSRIDIIENQSLPDILEAFKNQYQFDFSYDVEAIKNIKLDVDSGSISMDALIVLIKKQTQFILHKVDDYSYILIDNDKTIDICGFVIDSIDTFKLPEATIIKAKNVIKLTDSLGYFKLQLKSSDSISILHIGYETKTIKASDFSNSSCDTIRLQPDVQILNEVVINEYLTTGIQKNTDASINISTKKLRILPGLVEPDVLQSLQLVPGISSPTEDPAGLHIRGGTPDQNLVLWDGIKMYQSGHFFNQISTFNPYIVKNVKVYKGGTSVRYGDRVSGVVEIESDDDLTETLKIGGGANFTHTDVFAKVPLSKKVGVMGAFRRSTTDIYQNIGYNNLVKKVFQNTRADIPDDDTNEKSREDDFSFSDANFKLIWNPNANNNLKFSAILAENKLDNTIPLDSTNSFSTKDIYKINNAGASLNWRKKYSNNISQKTNFYVSSYKTRYSIARKLISDDENLSYDYTQNNDVKDIGLEYNLEIPITKKKALALGYQYTYNETIYKNREAITGDVEEAIDNYTTAFTNNHTLYSEYKYNGEKTYFNLGLRGSYLSRTNQTFIEPRIFSSVEVFKDFRITASAELKNQQLNSFSDAGSVSPSIRGLPVTDNIWILSGDTTRDEETFFIPVLKSRQFTLGALYSYKGWNFDLEGYYKKLIDITANNIILDFISLSEENDRGAIDLGTEKRIGFDFLIKKRIQNYRFWLGYSLSKSVVSFPMLQQKSYPGNFDRRHEFNISQTLKINNFEFALGWNYATGTPFTKLIPDENSFAGRMIDPNGINANRFKDYHRLDASAVYRFNFKTKKTWGGMIGFSLRNIYNRKNTINQGFIEVGEDDILIDTFERKSLRLTPDMVIRFNF